jgi:tRNA A37 threonylcarbamoyladenosine synthetase subunit TsaC/SUA5/YrdC
VPRAICEVFGPYATTSANRHGDPPLTEAGQVIERLPGVKLVLDAGCCDQQPSTVVDAIGDVPRLLREGRLAWDRILEVAGATAAG